MDKMVTRGRLPIHLQEAPKLPKEWEEGQDNRGRIAMLRQRDNFRLGQREYFHFFRLRYSSGQEEGRPHERGTDHVDQKGT